MRIEELYGYTSLDSDSIMDLALEFYEQGRKVEAVVVLAETRVCTPLDFLSWLFYTYESISTNAVTTRILRKGAELAILYQRVLGELEG